jgi:hypothetical protein
MNKKLIFPDVDYKNESKDNYVEISKNKLVSYFGVYPLQFNKDDRTTGELYINGLYSLKRIDKHDRYTYKVDATHRLVNDTLEAEVHSPSFVKLSQWESIYLKWHLKEYIVQDLDFKKNLIAGVLGVIFGVIITKLVA